MSESKMLKLTLLLIKSNSCILLATVFQNYLVININKTYILFVLKKKTVRNIYLKKNIYTFISNVNQEFDQSINLSYHTSFNTGADIIL